ncbi:hypothetical protein [Azospirillum sp. ST 5-10]|uniref:hypothetical protein n=1 Tax=unclassified Azospirillum TaxID=2630922 RepID=UPI003F4A067F
MYRSIVAGMVAAALLIAAPAGAEVSSKDVQVAAKTFGFTVPPLSGTVKVAIVFDAAVPESKMEADQLGGILGSGLAVGSATLTPVLVPVGQLDSGLEGAGVAFVTSGLSASHERIFAATKARKLLSVSADAACVQSARCVMGVKSEPKVEIVVSKTAAEASSVSFAPAFRMMITEL